MEVSISAEDGFVREWAPCSHILSLIPARIQNGLFSNELCLTCVDAVPEYIALGTNVGLVYWYDRKKGTIQRLRCEASSSAITFVKIVNTVDYMVGAGNAAGQVTVFQIPKEHPENIPDTLKPKVEPKVERYTIGDLHKSEITAIEWSKNGMRLFSGDKNGVIIMTEIDFYMHLCKSVEIVDEGHEIVQLSCHQNLLLVCSVYRGLLCERGAGGWSFSQLGKKDRKSLCGLGGVWCHSYSMGGAATAYCARPGLRLWRADCSGQVTHTLMFKDAISNPLTVVELLNPRPPPRARPRPPALGRVAVFRERFLVSYDDAALCILEPSTLTAVAVVDDLRRILSVSVSRDEIFILEGPRSLLRLAPAPDLAHNNADDPLNMMTKSFTTSIQQAVNTVRDLAHIDHTVPYITSVLEQPIAMLTKNELVHAPVAEECFELPPIKSLPDDISNNVLESIINEFKDVTSDAEEIRRVKTEEIARKLKLYNSIMERKGDSELIHSRRSRRREGAGAGAGGGPARGGVSYTAPCLMEVSVYGDLPQESDDLLEQQIEEKEKILAKMLNLESLSIKTSTTEPTQIDNTPIFEPNVDEKHLTESVEKSKPRQPKKNPNPIETIPKVVQLPNTWNLENIELKLDLKANLKDAKTLASPDEHLENDWEII